MKMSESISQFVEDVIPGRIRRKRRVFCKTVAFNSVCLREERIRIL